MIDLTNLLAALFAVLATVVTIYVIPRMRATFGDDGLSKIQMWVRVAVMAAEQLYTGSGQGPAKKAYALDYLRKAGFTLDTDVLSGLIESAVHELKHWGEV